MYLCSGNYVSSFPLRLRGCKRDIDYFPKFVLHLRRLTKRSGLFCRIDGPLAISKARSNSSLVTE